MPLSISQQTEKPRSTRRTRRPNLTERKAKQLGHFTKINIQSKIE